MKEIGSEFWLEKHHSQATPTTLAKQVQFGDDQRLLFSGRTAIDYVLEDITKPINSVYMPSYCCDSMLKPFIKRNISIEFYDVIPSENGLKYLVDYEKQIDVFFAMSYFGFQKTNMDSIVEKFIGREILVIEDITHRLLCEQNHCKNANYYVASLRKWFAIPSGGLAIKQKSKFKDMALVEPAKSLVNKKINAMEMKSRYIRDFKNGTKDNEVLKKDFMKLFSEFNSDLQRNYVNMAIDNISKELLTKIDITEIKKQRQTNAKLIYEKLEKFKNVELLIKKPDLTKDCPLFVPLLIQENIRERVKRQLIENDIFCPVHWPISNNCVLTDRTVKLYNEELSLVCDQRYGHNDIKRLVSTLGGFLDNL